MGQQTFNCNCTAYLWTALRLRELAAGNPGDLCNVTSISTPHLNLCRHARRAQAAAAAGLHPDIPAAVKAMVHVARVVQPNPEAHAAYQGPYERYKQL